MSYVLQKTKGRQKGYYIYSGYFIHRKLSRAKVFRDARAADRFKENSDWSKTYEIVKVSKKELFKAKLTDT